MALRVSVSQQLCHRLEKAYSLGTKVTSNVGGCKTGNWGAMCLKNALTNRMTACLEGNRNCESAPLGSDSAKLVTTFSYSSFVRVKQLRLGESWECDIGKAGGRCSTSAVTGASRSQLGKNSAGLRKGVAELAKTPQVFGMARSEAARKSRIS